jgi:hypothetical protein
MNMKIVKFIGISMIIIIIICFGFSNETIYKNYNYAGESKYWLAKYDVKSIEKFTLINRLSSIISNSPKTKQYEYSCKVTKIFTITYKGDINDLYQKKLFFEYISSASKGSRELTFDTLPKDKVFKIQSSGEGNSIEDRDEIIKVLIKLDNKIERLSLQPVQ